MDVTASGPPSSVPDVSQPTSPPVRPAETPERRIATRLVDLRRLVLHPRPDRRPPARPDRARPIDWAVVGLVVVVGFAAIRHRQAVAGARGRPPRGGRVASPGSCRACRARSRPTRSSARSSTSSAGATGADHIVVARRRPDARVLEATLVSARPGVPDSTTRLPIADLEDPVDAGRGPRPSAMPVAIPVRRRASASRRRPAACAAGLDGPRPRASAATAPLRPSARLERAGRPDADRRRAAARRRPDRRAGPARSTA